MDKFPEAFRRFESDVDIRRFRSYFELVLAFQSWAGQKWKGTTKLWEALDSEAENVGFTPPTIYGKATGQRRFSTNDYVSARKAKAVTWKYEVVNVKGKPHDRYRDLKTGRFIRKP